METITTDTIIDTMREWVENKVAIGPERWLDAAAKLNVLIHGEQEKYFKLDQNIAVMKMRYKIDKDTSVAEANAYVQTKDEYLQMRLQEAKIKQVQEFIRIAKKMSTMSDQEYKQQR